jgi:hypothetical protein
MTGSASSDAIWRGLLTGEDSPIPHQRRRYRLPGGDPVVAVGAQG